jgi:hypothetical protein
MRKRSATFWALGLSGLLAAFAHWTVPIARTPVWAQVAGRDDPAPRLAEQRASIKVLADAILARLDRVSELEHQSRLQEVTTAQAEEASKTAGRKVDQAKTALAEYLNGTFAQEHQLLLGEIALAESDVNRADDRLAWMERMEKKGYRPLNHLAEAQADVQRAKFILDQADTKRLVLEKHGKTAESAKVEAAQEDFQAKRAIRERESEKKAMLARRVREESLSSWEAQAVALLDEAMRLHDQRQVDPAQAKLDEANRLWRKEEALRAELRFAEAMRRIGKAAEELRKPK